MKFTELLAPAGDFACLRAAFNAGADAVYLAGKSFGARAFANNFEEEELIEALNYAHLLNKKIYLTLNTLIKESEFGLLVTYLTPYYEHGLDGIIIQDLGLIPLLKEEFPLLELHASTQMTVNNYRSAAWLKEQGICRVVPSRELSLKELKEIKEKAGIEVEAFIHGAMCYGYSGQCLFSSFLGGRSGNRGRCAQPCRLPYSVNLDGSCSTGKKEVYPLSLKDLCSLPYIYELLDAGIDSFKIEGRMKSPEYVAGVTAVYRKYMDFYAKGKRPAIEKADLEQLSHLYIRSEMKDGYFKKHNGKDMVSLYSPSYQGCDDKLVEKIHNRYCEFMAKLPVSGVLSLIMGEPAVLTVTQNDVTAVVYGAQVQKAMNRPLTEEDAAKQIKKTGNSLFSFEELYVEIQGNVFVPVKQLNELRREALNELQDMLLQSHKRDKEEIESVIVHRKENLCEPIRNHKPAIRASVYSKEQLHALVFSGLQIERLYVPADLFYLKQADSNEVIAKAKEEGIEIYLSMPRILRTRDENYLSFVKERMNVFPGILVKNLETLYFLQKEGYQGRIDTDFMLYHWNKSAIRFLDGFRDEFTYPLELSLREIKELDNREGMYVVYGRTPMMVSANCIRKTTGECRQNANSFAQTLKDRYRKELPVYANCVHCYNEIFNAMPMSLHKDFSQLLKNNITRFRLDFTDESPKETIEITEYYLRKIVDSSFTREFPVKEYTTGHYKEGAV